MKDSVPTEDLHHVLDHDLPELLEKEIIHEAVHRLAVVVLVIVIAKLHHKVEYWEFLE